MFVEFNKRFIIVVLYLDTSTSHGVESVILSYRWFKINFKLTFYMLIKLFVNYLWTLINLNYSHFRWPFSVWIRKETLKSLLLSLSAFLLIWFYFEFIICSFYDAKPKYRKKKFLKKWRKTTKNVNRILVDVIARNEIKKKRERGKKTKRIKITAKYFKNLAIESNVGMFL